MVQLQDIPHPTIKREGNQWISLTGFSPTLKTGSQKPPETVSVVEKLKNFRGSMPPDLLSIGKLMRTTIFFADIKTLEVLVLL
jgi:hypothetical protein